ncbi:hypothetical protein [Streptomyces sp. NPDC059371]|uniref:hypothetical protein n=1 Tax=Streptomyces sp. NPDC059371 TaxID=3346812 RepID=UPI0036B48A8C
MFLPPFRKPAVQPTGVVPETIGLECGAGPFDMAVPLGMYQPPPVAIPPAGHRASTSTMSSSPTAFVVVTT